MATMQEYMKVMEEDEKLRNIFKSEPEEAIHQARLSFEDKAILRTCDPEEIAKAAGVTSLSQEVRETLAEASKKLGSG